jgi:hypothetical protein
VSQGVVWKKLVTLQGLLLHYSITWAYCLWRTCSEPAPAVVTKNDWSLGGITEDTYVTLTLQTLMEQLQRTQLITTDLGFSVYMYGQNSQANHGIITLMGVRAPALPPAPAPAPAPA